MKKVLLSILFLCLAAPIHAQIEQGDTEVSILGYFATFIGKDIDANGMGTLQLSYGKYITPFLMIGIAPNVTFFTSENEEGESMIEAKINGSVFFNLNLARASKIIPYITGQFYQYEFDIPEGYEFTDFSYANVGIGFKNFINEYASFNTLVTYGFSLAEEAEGGILMVMTGLSFIF